MGPGQAIKSGLRHYARFSGRATAPEFWWLVIALTLVEVVIVTVFEKLGGFDLAIIPIAGFQISALFAATCIAITIPLLSVSWRRLHDIGWVGWWVLLWAAIVMFFGNILMSVIADIGQCQIDGGKKCVAEIGWGYGFAPAAALLIFVVGFGILMSRPSQAATNQFGPEPSEVA